MLCESLRDGSYNVDFNVSKLSSGVYFYRIDAGKYVSAKKMILLKVNAKLIGCGGKPACPVVSVAQPLLGNSLCSLRNCV